ncbi:pyruvate dehydrogenase E2 component (dihydrolipoamide acetyltransferase) [Dendrobium catenatum]|uniref:Pyruvate dehydrogenase E2 component (Dihydrolipoamide acetyltransferase) n=1 Tax=Dendrobium catenatum TaxID=906689 RepID=A0A2I0XCL1_9ASPA|nr:pyruvate dehydrogenase E2 component (dihydrolipoamide acetyltransferase) [Dendrobium catenatum]
MEVLENDNYLLNVSASPILSDVGNKCDSLLDFGGNVISFGLVACNFVGSMVAMVSDVPMDCNENGGLTSNLKVKEKEPFVDAIRQVDGSFGALLSQVSLGQILILLLLGPSKRSFSTASFSLGICYRSVASPPPAKSDLTLASSAHSPSDARRRILATPYAKKLAMDLKVELQSIFGTSPMGRIVAKD